MTASEENNGRGTEAFVDGKPTNPTAGRETQGVRTRESPHTSLICIKANHRHTLKQICKLRASVTNLGIDSWHCRHLQEHPTEWLCEQLRPEPKDMESSFPQTNCAGLDFGWKQHVNESVVA